MELSQRFSVAQLDEIEPVSCPCGMARRAFGDLNGVASLHMVDISKDSETHYHKEMHEIYAAKLRRSRRFSAESR